MHKKILEKRIHNSRGFSLIEVLLGISVFMIGMLGVTALNISSLKSNTFSGNLSEAVIIAGDRIEELMLIDYDHADLDDTDGDGTDQDDTNNNGIDDDDDGSAVVDGKGNFGLDHTGSEADHEDLDVGKNNMFDVYWNVADEEPLPENTKTVNVIVEWQVKGNTRRINMTFIRMISD